MLLINGSGKPIRQLQLDLALHQLPAEHFVFKYYKAHKRIDVAQPGVDRCRLHPPAVLGDVVYKLYKAMYEISQCVQVLWVECICREQEQPV